MKRQILPFFLMVLLMISLVFSCVSVSAELAVPKRKVVEETTTYEASTVRIKVEQWLYDFNKSDLRFFVAEVWVKDPSQFKTAFARDEYSKNRTEATSAIAERHGAVLACNGDYYNYKDKIGLVIRNGELYRDKTNKNRDILLVMKDGSLVAIPRNEYEAGHGKEYVDEGVVHSFTFGPILVKDGQPYDFPKSHDPIYTSETVREPRTGIGWVEEGHYVFLVADGRRDNWSDKGMALQEMREVFYEKGCQVAYNLDGGGSATLYINGQRVNKTSGSREREVSDIICIVP
ncbi:MAG: phosphodiester glycosidase family protein [Clostridiales bacterium]|nr:phosphodiester glycosidase family protein [Clostridiales bacterium]